jgi:D-sedoheptulose 7-phosphate isomerase
MYDVVNELQKIKGSIETLIGDPVKLLQIELLAQLIVKALGEGNKILLMGNGGSAADAQHLAAEFVSQFNYDRPGLAAIALTTDTSILTAIGNDYGYDRLFARQVQALGSQGDILIGMSTSGTSKNIIAAFNEAKNKNILTIGMCGESVGQFDSLCDHVFRAPAVTTPKIQEIHIIVGHILCGLVESSIFPKSDF